MPRRAFLLIGFLCLPWTAAGGGANVVSASGTLPDLESLSVARLVEFPSPGKVGRFLNPAAVRSPTEMELMLDDIERRATDLFVGPGAPRAPAVLVQEYVLALEQLPDFRTALLALDIEFESEALVILHYYFPHGPISNFFWDEPVFNDGTLILGRTERHDGTPVRGIPPSAYLGLAVRKDAVRKVNFQVDGRTERIVAVSGERPRWRALPPLDLEVRVFPKQEGSAEAHAARVELTRAARARNLDHIPGVYMISFRFDAFPYARREANGQHHVYDRDGISAAEWSGVLVGAVGGLLLSSYAESSYADGFVAILTDEQLELLKEVPEIERIEVDRFGGLN